MKIVKPLILLLLSMCHAAYGQKQNNIWCFGNKALVDFNNATPTVGTSQINAREGGAATVCNRHTGQLLFYTDSRNVWDRTGTVMPNGAGIGTDVIFTCAQGSVIVPHPGDSNRYFVFTQEDISKAGSVYYSIVDMTLNGGLGDVVSGQKLIQIGTNFVEGMTTALSCDGQWLVLFERGTLNFVLYKITVAGINTTPVKSLVTLPPTGTSLCGIKVSPQSDKILLVTYNPNPTSSYAALCDLNIQTGVVSNAFVFDTYAGNNYYSGAFSSDGSKVYIGTFLEKKIYQFNLSLGTQAAIIGSKNMIHTATFYPGDLQLGPDSNIYVSLESSTFLDRISNANSATPVYTTNAITLAPGTNPRLSLPQSVLFPVTTPVDSSYMNELTICTGEEYKLVGRPGATSYKWHDNSSNASFILSQQGTYWVKSNFLCKSVTDTYKVTVVGLPVDLGNDTSFCAGEQLQLTVNATGNPQYLWSNGNTTNSITVSSSGQYYVTASLGDCTGSDTIQISVNESAVFGLGNDTSLCAGAKFDIVGPAEFDSYNWNNGYIGQILTIEEPGQYFLNVRNEGCEYGDTIDITYEDGNIDLGNDSTFCNSEEWLLDATSLSGSTYAWSVGGQDATVVIKQSGTIWAVITNRCGIFTDTVKADFANCDCSPFVPSFTPNNDGLNDKIKPMLNCEVIDYQFIIFNRFGEVVFKSTIPEERWDGTYKGQAAEMSTYFYQLKLKNIRGKDFLFKGDIVLIR